MVSCNGENKRGTAKHFRVDLKHVYEWLQKEDELNKLKGCANKYSSLSH